MTGYHTRPLLAALLLPLVLAGAGPLAAQDGSTTAGPPPAGSQTVEASRVCPAVPERSTTGIATPLDDLARLVEIQTDPTVSRSVRRHSEARWPACRAPGAGSDTDSDAVGSLVAGSLQAGPLGAIPWRVTPRTARIDAAYRTGYPDDRNNGALWAGRGASTVLEAGVEVRAGPVSAALVPQLLYQQNSPYDFPRRRHEGFSQFIYPHYTTQIDLPQRHGPDPFSSAEWGQSYIRADGYGVAAGISTENLWWGPATRYPIIMSNTAPGMPHLFLGTSGPTDIWIGLLDAELVWARSTESEYFDEIPENDRHMMGGLALAFSPRPLPGLWLGLARAYHYQDDGWNDFGQLLATAGLGTADFQGNQIGSVFARWVFPSAGAEIYGEWAREDRSWDIPEFIQEPDHSQAYMIGFQKVTPLTAGYALRVEGELVALQELPELRTGSRPLPVYYMHDKINQGHTHRGQLLGAGVGPGADAQFIGLDVMADFGLAGLYVERVRRATFSARALDMRRRAPFEHDAELTGGLRSTFLIRDLSISGDVAYTFRYNRDLREDDTNWSLRLAAAWLPGSRFRLP